MTILVTGATSGLGRNAVDYLLAQGRPLRASGRNPQALAQLRALGVDAVAADLARLDDDRAAELLRGVDCVWHCAALSSPWGAAADFHAANVQATDLLAQAAIRHGVRRFVHISTPSLYFDYRHRQQIPESFQAARFANHYAASKAAAEQVITGLAQRQRDTHFVMLRPRGLFGPHDRTVLPRLLAFWRQRGGTLLLPGGGRACVDLTYSGNVVHAMWLASHATGMASGSAYNISNQQPVCLQTLLETLFAQLELPLRIKAVPWPVLDVLARVLELHGHWRNREPAFTRYSIGALNFDMTLDNRKAQQELGYFPLHDLPQAIMLTAQWIRQYGPIAPL